MHILLLPGINAKTERWATNLLQEIAAPDRTMHIHRYQHWDCADGQCLGVSDEVERLRGSEVDLLIGLSLGVMVGIDACRQGVLTPKRMVCIGTPVTSFKEKSLDLGALVAGLNLPCLFIQQINDIVGPAASLRAAIAGIPATDLVEIPGDNHQYKDLKLLARYLKKCF